MCTCCPAPDQNDEWQRFVRIWWKDYRIRGETQKYQQLFRVRKEKPATIFHRHGIKGRIGNQRKNTLNYLNLTKKEKKRKILVDVWQIFSAFRDIFVFRSIDLHFSTSARRLLWASLYEGTIVCLLCCDTSLLTSQWENAQTGGDPFTAIPIHTHFFLCRRTWEIKKCIRWKKKNLRWGEKNGINGTDEWFINVSFIHLPHWGLPERFHQQENAFAYREKRVKATMERAGCMQRASESTSKCINTHQRNSSNSRKKCFSIFLTVSFLDLRMCGGERGKKEKRHFGYQ